MNGVFYEKFERHAHGEGLKGRATHYCAGCGHGLAHRFLAQAIEELEIQDRTIAISPVGCSVFLYYYFDVGNSQAAHGRAPAVALGHKMANPKSIVVSYQGDGDLASIGLAEIMQVAQMGIPITVIFINNAIYGMTGGQMAPTTLHGTRTTTTPDGRSEMTGEPLKMAEIMAGLDGPIYVERVALFDNKQRNRAKKAIKKGLKMQMEGRGFSFIEVVAECPTHLKMNTSDAEKWVRDNMIPVFHLGVLKDVEKEPWFDRKMPSYSPDKLLESIGGLPEKAPRFCKSFPAHIAENDIALKFAGAGGDGAQTAALLVTRAAINEGFDSTHIPSYGPESRGGTSYADIHIADGEVLSPASPEPNILVAFNAPSLAKFSAQVQEGGTIIYDSSVISSVPKLNGNINLIGVPMTLIARELGNAVVKNIVALGALQEATDILPAETFLTAIRIALSDKGDLIPLNEQAFKKGKAAAAIPR